MPYTLVIAEKKSQAEAIASGLGIGPAGLSFAGNYGGQSLVIVWAKGHLYELAEPEKITPGLNWRDPGSALPLPTEFQWEPQRDARDYISRIHEKAKGASRIVIATDPDREGEGIGRHPLRAIGWKGPLDRLWLTAGLDEASIRKAWKAIVPASSKDGVFNAHLARSHSDYLTIYATTAATATAKTGAMGPELAAGKRSEGVVPVGRVQNAVLRILVEHDRAILDFKPVDHYGLTIDVKQNSRTPLSLDYAAKIADAQKGQPIPGCLWQEVGNGQKLLFTNADTARAFRDQLLKQPTASLKVTRRKAKKLPPKPYTLLELQKAASKAFRITSAKTLEALASLYQNKHVSYPRTERPELPNSEYEAAPGILSMLAKFPELQPAGAAAALHSAQGAVRPRCYVANPGEHHGLMPTARPPQLNALSDRERKVYLLVSQRYIEAHLPDAILDVVEIEGFVPVSGLVNDQPARFFKSGETVLTPGWMTAFREPPKGTLPVADDGPATIESAKLTKHKTTPPEPMTEEAWLTAMKNAGRYAVDPNDAEALKSASGIGTPSTRAATIEKLLDRKLVSREKKYIRSTARGQALIDQLPDHITSVAMTAKWEQALATIDAASEPEATRLRELFLTNTNRQITKLIQTFVAKCESVRTADGALPTSPGGPSKAMLDYAVKLAATARIEVPPEVRADFQACRTFIDTHRASGTGSPAPTQKQVLKARAVAAEKKLSLPEGYDTNQSVCSAFLDQHSGPLSQPSSAMVRLARDLAAKAKKTPPAGYETNYAACKKFIDSLRQ